METKEKSVRLIDANPIRERFEKWLAESREILDRHDEDEDAAYASYEAYDGCLSEIICADTVYAVPVVRCGYCKHMMPDGMCETIRYPAAS